MMVGHWRFENIEAQELVLRVRMAKTQCHADQGGSLNISHLGKPPDRRDTFLWSLSRGEMLGQAYSRSRGLVFLLSGKTSGDLIEN